jgi:hypothetical protein
MLRTICPAGPEIDGFLILNEGLVELIVAPPTGSTGTGTSMTTGVMIEKLAAAEYGPVLAPSSARARQKNGRPVGSRSAIWMLVRPPSPGATLPRANTRFVNCASAASWNVYVNGRWPFVEAFSMSNRSGWLALSSSQPDPGSSSLGSEITTPGMGPAIEGLRGFPLLTASQPQPKTATTPRIVKRRALPVMAPQPQSLTAIRRFTRILFSLPYSGLGAGGSA